MVRLSQNYGFHTEVTATLFGDNVFYGMLRLYKGHN